MADTVDDLLDTLHGPISDQLRQREGVRLSKVHVKQGSVGPKPEDNKDVHPGELHHEDLNRTERKQVESGGHIEGLDEE